MRKFPLHVPSWHGMCIGEKSAEKGNKENFTQIKAYINKIITFVFAGIYRQVTTETADIKKESMQLSVDTTQSDKSLAYLYAEDVKVIV